MIFWRKCLFVVNGGKYGTRNYGGLCVPLLFLFFPSPPLSSLLYSLFPSLLKAENAARFSSIPLLLFPPVGGSSRRWWKVLSLAAWKERGGKRQWVQVKAEAGGGRAFLFPSLLFLGVAVPIAWAGNILQNYIWIEKIKKFLFFWVRERERAVQMLLSVRF